MTTTRLLALTLFSVAPCLTAQVELSTLLPTSPVAELRIRKTKAFLTRLQVSRVGKVLTDASMTEVWTQLTQNEELVQAWQDLARRSDENIVWMELLWKLLRDHEIDVQIAGGFGRGQKEPAGWWVAGQLSGGKQALEGFSKSFAREIARHEVPETGKMRLLGGDRIYVGGDAGSHQLVAPFLHEGALWFFLGSDCKRSFGRVRKEPQESLIHDRDEPFVLAADLGAIMSIWGSGVSADAGSEDYELMQALGLTELRGMEFSLDVRAGRVIQAFDFTIPAKGLFAEVMSILAVKEGKARELLRHMPEATQTGDVWSTDPRRLYRVITAGIEQVAKAQGEGPLELERMFEGKFGFELVKGLIDPLDGRFFSYQDFGGKAEAPEQISGFDFSTSCMCLGIEDSVTFGKSVDTVIRKLGLHVSRKKDDYREARLYRFKFMGLIEVHYALLDDLFIVAYGSNPGLMLRRIVDRERDLAAGKPGFAPDPNLEHQLSLASPVISGLRVADLSTMVGGFAQLMNQLEDLGLGQEDGSMTKIVQAVSQNALPLLKKHGVATSITTMGRHRKSLRLLSIW